MTQANEPSADYPIGGMIEPYDIWREDIMLEEYESGNTKDNRE